MWDKGSSAQGNQALAEENKQMTMMTRIDARRTQMLIDMQREMADLVETGDMTRTKLTSGSIGPLIVGRASDERKRKKPR